MSERMPCGCIVDNEKFKVVELCSFHFGEIEKNKVENQKTLSAGVVDEQRTKDGMGR